jgi:hypothetical protein
MARSVLYYPFMDIPDTGWLRNALLHWDNLYTLVPAGLDVPYRSRDTRLLADEGIVDASQSMDGTRSARTGCC